MGLRGNVAAPSGEQRSVTVDDMTQAVLEYVIDEYVDEDDDDVEVGPDTPLITSGIVDSFSMVSLKTFLEKKYGISLPDSEATPEAFDTVSSIVTLVKKHQG
jgi:acyl carrier protein